MTMSRFLTLASFILLASLTRLIPHPPNFSPVAAVALFGGAHFTRRTEAFIVPLVALFIGDIFIGLHVLMPVVYGSFVLIVLLGIWVSTRLTPLTLAGAALTGSVLFFLITNFAVWAAFTTYPHTPSGLLAAYVAGLPYFMNTLLGAMFYTAILFGGFALAARRYPALAKRSVG